MAILGVPFSIGHVERLFGVSVAILSAPLFWWPSWEGILCLFSHFVSRASPAAILSGDFSGAGHFGVLSPALHHLGPFSPFYFCIGSATLRVGFIQGEGRVSLIWYLRKGGKGSRL